MLGRQVWYIVRNFPSGELFDKIHITDADSIFKETELCACWHDLGLQTKKNETEKNDYSIVCYMVEDGRV